MKHSVVWLAAASAVLVVAAWVGGAATPRPGHSQPSAIAPAAGNRLRLPPRTSSLRIEGEVAGVAAGHSGTLTVRVGGVVQQQLAATAGAFAVDVPEGPGSGLVSLEYTQPGIHFTSLLGSYALLARIAGTDGRLNRQECECTRVSAFSTGLQHVAETLLGHAPRSDVELDNAVRRMGNDLSTATVALARLADEPGLLPASHATGLALLRDPAAFASYLRDTGYSLLDDPAGVLAGVPAADLADADVPARTAFVGAVLDVRSPLAATATVMEREGDAFTLHGGVAELGRSYTGAIENGGLVMTPAVEIAYTNPMRAWCPSTLQMTGERTEVLRRELRRQWASDRLAIWRMTAESEISYPDCPELASSIQHSAGFATVVDLAGTRALTNARRFQGRVALPVFCSAADEYGSELMDCAYAIHAFTHNGTGEIVELGNKVDDRMEPVQASGRVPFSWAMGDDGAMHVQAGAEHVRYWVLDGGDGAALGVVYVADANREAGNVSIAGYTAMIRTSVPDFYTASSAVGAWGYGTMDLANRPHVDRPFPVRVRVVRDASGRSVQWSNDSPSHVEQWTTAWGRLYSTTYSDRDCVAPSAQCWPDTVRYFRPLARVGNRIHGIEEYYVNAGGEPPNYGALQGWARPQFHEVRDMPTTGAHAASKPATTTARLNRSGVR